MVDLSPTFLYTDTSEKTVLLSGKEYTYWRVEPACMKAQAHSSLEPPLGYNQYQISLMSQDWL